MSLTQDPILIAILSIFGSTCITLLLIPKVNALGNAFQLTDEPGSRKIHEKPIVRVGGIAIFLGFIISTLITQLIISDTSYINYNLLILIIFGGSSCFLLGVVDDIYKLTPWSRLLIQILIAFICWSQGIRVEAIDLSWLNSSTQILFSNYYLEIIITLIWIVGTINAINWIDGLDGLAGGVSGIISFFLIILGICFNNYEIMIIASCSLGSSLGFLRYNFFPAKILMGDGGSYLYGFILATSTLLISSKNDSFIFLNSSVLLLAIPIFDMLLVIAKRVLLRKSPFYPDKNHLHHRLLKKGLSQKQTCLTIYAAVFLCCILYLFLEEIINLPKFILLITTAFTIIIINNLKTYNQIE